MLVLRSPTSRRGIRMVSASTIIVCETCARRRTEEIGSAVFVRVAWTSTARKRTEQQVWKVLREWCPWNDWKKVLKGCWLAMLLSPGERDLS